MTSSATVLQVLEFFRSAPLADAQQVQRLVQVLLKGRHVIPDLGSERVQHHGPAPSEKRPVLLPVPPSQPESIRDKAIEVLRDAGRVMESQEIADAVVDRFGTPHTKASVVGALSRGTKTGDAFYRAAKGKYGLLEWTGTKPPSATLNGSAPEPVGTE